MKSLMMISLMHKFYSKKTFGKDLNFYTNAPQLKGIYGLSLLWVYVIWILVVVFYIHSAGGIATSNISIRIGSG